MVNTVFRRGSGRASKFISNYLRRNTGSQGNMSMNLSQVLAAVSDSITIERIDNGYILDIRGEDSQERYKSYRRYLATMAEVCEVMAEYETMDKAD